MSIVKAFYHKGKVEFIEKPSQQQQTDVFVIFPEEKTEMRTFRGAAKKMGRINYKGIADELHDLSKQSENHIQKEINNGAEGENSE